MFSDMFSDEPNMLCPFNGLKDCQADCVASSNRVDGDGKRTYMCDLMHSISAIGRFAERYCQRNPERMTFYES